ncbi:MAG: hypothetical protein M1429_03000 [Patescibacteria group bacterium]|nr:hypothetical protein [Patescibacteria group bacterium]
MKQISLEKINLCKKYRKEGLSHRDIKHKLNISLGTIFKYTKDIKLSQSQHLALKQKCVSHHFTPEQCKKGGLNCPNKFQIKHTKEDLINFIQDFTKKKGRIPTKREVSSHHPYIRIFGSWNNAIKQAGFKVNPVKFAHRHRAFDGHYCDSFAEFVIDNWLYQHNIPHQIHVRYPNSAMSSDFLINNVRIEFLGLAGQHKKYDQLLKRKRKLIKKHNLKIIEIYPQDIFPVNKLDQVFHSFLIHDKNSKISPYKKEIIKQI